jgi:hypothetical protein
MAKSKSNPKEQNKQKTNIGTKRTDSSERQEVKNKSDK